MAAFLFVNKSAASHVLTHSHDAERQSIRRHIQQRRQRVVPWAKHTSTLLLQQTYPTANHSDPFYCTVAGTDMDQNILHYTFSSFAMATFLAEALAPPGSHHVRHAAMLKRRAQRCVTDEMLMYATLAYGCCGLSWAFGFQSNRPVEYYIGRTIQAMKPRLAHVDDWVLLSIYALAVTESWIGAPRLWTGARREIALRIAPASQRATRIHIEALCRLTNQGKMSVDPYVLESVLLADKFLAIREGTRPVLPLTSWEPPRLRGEAKLATGFASLDRDLLDVIHDMAVFFEYARHAWTTSATDTIFLRLQALNYRLLNLSLQDRDDCVRWALLLFLQLVVRFRGNQAAAANIAPRLRAAIDKDDTSHLMLWCCSMGGMAEMSEHQSWFIERVAQLSQDLPREYQPFAILLERFFFAEERQKDQLVTLIGNLRKVNLGRVDG